MLTLLSNDRTNDGDYTSITVLGELELNVLKSAKYCVGECRGKSERAVEIGDWKLVFASLDGVDFVGRENRVGIVGMKFFLGLDRNQGVDQSSTCDRVVDLELIDIVGDIEEQIGEVGDLENLVEGNQLDAGYVIWCQSWSSTIGFNAMSQVVDYGLCAVTESRES